MVNVAFVRKHYSCCGDRVRTNCLMLRAPLFLSVLLLMSILPVKDTPGLELISSGGTDSSPDLYQPGSRLGGYAVNTSSATLYGLRMMDILAQAAPGVEPASPAKADAGSPSESPAAKEMSVRVIDVLTDKAIPGAAISRERIIRQVVQAEESGRVTFREPPEMWEIKITADGYDSVTERLPWKEEVTIFLLPSEVTVRFKVTAKDSGASVEGAILNLSVDDKEFPEARANAEGACSTTDKPKVGKWSLDIKAGGFVPQTINFEKFPGLEDPARIELVRSNITLQFHIVEEKSRGPVSNALVRLRREDWPADTVRSQPTDFEGGAEFQDVDWSKGWTVSVQRAEYFPYRGSTDFTGISLQNLCINKIGLAPEKKVKFCVWDNITKKPSPGAQVKVRQDSLPPPQQESTDENGFAEFTINPNKACEVSVTARGYEPFGTTWSDGQETDLKLQQLPWEKVSFSLKNKETGDAIPGGLGAKMTFSRAGMDFPMELPADTNGVVEFENNLHFEWQVHVEANEFWPLDVPAWTRGGETTLQLDLAIIRTEFLIKDQITEKPVSGATLSLSAERQKLEATTDEEGKAVFKINPRLKWQLTVTADGYAALQEDWKPVGKTDRQIGLAERKAVFSVMDRITGKPVSGAAVGLGHANRELASMEGSTDQRGIAVFAVRPYPGWELAVAADQYAPLKTAWEYAEGTLVQIELAPVKAEFSVKDRVTEKAVPGATVMLTHSNPRLSRVQATTGQNGIALIEFQPYPGWELAVAADGYPPLKKAWEYAEKTLVEIELAALKAEFSVKDRITENGVPGATVTLTHPNPRLSPIQVTTDQNGIALIEIQPYPGWELALAADGYPPLRRAWEIAEKTPTEIELTSLKAEFSVKDRIAERGVPGATVTLTHPNPRLSPVQATTDQNGVALMEVKPYPGWEVGVALDLYSPLKKPWEVAEKTPVTIELARTRVEFSVKDGFFTDEAIWGAVVELSHKILPPIKQTTDQNGFAVFEIQPYPGWQVTVNGDLTNKGYSPFKQAFEGAPPAQTVVRIEWEPMRFPIVVGTPPEPVPGAKVRLFSDGRALEGTADETGVAAMRVPRRADIKWAVRVEAGYKLYQGEWTLGDESVNVTPFKAPFSVIDRITEKPVPAATVELSKDGRVVEKGTTDPNGRVEVEINPYLSWRVEVKAEGYAPLEQALEPLAKIPEPPTPTVLKIELAPLKATFLVKDRITEKPVAQATVALTHSNKLLAPLQGTTDQNGAVVLQVKPYPGWELTLTADQYTPLKQAWEYLEQTTLEVQLAKRKAVFSIQDSKTEKPVPGATVSLAHTNAKLTPSQGTTDENGNVVLNVEPYPAWEITLEAKGYGALDPEKKGWEYAENTVLSLNPKIPPPPPRVVRVLLNWSHQWTGSQSITWLRGEMMALAKALKKPEGGQLQVSFLARGKEKDWPADLVARGEFPADLPVASAVDLPANLDWILSAERNPRDFVLVTWPDELMDEGNWGNSLRQKYNREPSETLRGASLIVIQIGGERIGLLSNALGDERYKVVKARESGAIVSAALPWLVHRAGEPGFAMEAGSKEVFNHPFGVAVDSRGNVLVADSSNNRIQRLDSLGRLERSWGEVGSADGNLRSPHGVAIDRAGNVLVADTGNHRIQRFDSSGRFLSKWGKFGSSDGEFNAPSAVAADSSGNVFVADYLNHRIQKFDPSGRFEARWGQEGSGDREFRHPCGIVVNSCGTVFVADTWNHRIQTFDASGRFLSKWGSPGSDGGQFNLPSGIAVDSWGDIWVADWGNHRIQVFDSSGKFIQQYGSEGSGKGEFLCPGAVGVDSTGNVFASDTGNQRIQKFGPFFRDAPYAVGALFAVTGPASFLGEPEKKTAEMIAEQINAAGGIRGHPLKLIVEDTTTREAAAVMSMRELIEEDRVCALIGPSTSGETLALVKIAEEYKVPLISCAAAASIVQPIEGREWVFKVPQMDSDCARRIYDYMRERRWTKVAIITPTTGFGAAGKKQLEDLAREYGIEIVAYESYGPRDTDMTVQLTKIKDTDAQALINWDIGEGQITVLKNARQLGLTMQRIQSHGFGNLKYVELAGEAAEGVIFPCGAPLAPEILPDDHPQKGVVTWFKSDYEAKYKESVSTFGGYAHDALHLVIEALKEVGPDRARIRQYIENKKGFVGTAGVFNFSPNDHCGLDKTAFVMYTVENKKFELVPAQLRPGEVRVLVRKGDTLWAISRKCGASTEAICERNSIRDPALLREGRELIIPLPETKQLKTGLFTYHRAGESKGYFRLVVQGNPDDKDPGVLPKDIVFVVDSSKSIPQRKLNAYAEGVKLCLRNLHPQDRFNIVEFKDLTRKCSQDDVVSVSPETIARAEEFLSGLVSDGGTNVCKALTELLTQKPAPGRSRIIFFISDGRPTTGIRRDAEILEQVTKQNTGKASIFAFGGGLKINASLLLHLSYANGGASGFETEDQKIATSLFKFYQEHASPVLTDARLAFRSGDTLETYPKCLSDLLLGAGMEVFGRFENERELNVVLSGETEGTTIEYALQRALPLSDNGDRSIARMWALHKICCLVGEIVQKGPSPEIISAIENLSTDYGLPALYDLRAGREIPQWHGPLPVGLAGSSASVSGSGLVMYYCVPDRADLEIGRAYRADVSSNWVHQGLIPELHSDSWDMHPSVSADELVMVFTRYLHTPGCGYTDLWMSTRASKDDPWGNPVLLPTPVNTNSHDAAASLSADALTFYFHSSRGRGIHDYAIYMCTRQSRGDPWGDPTLIQALDSSGPESYPAISSDGLGIYLVKGGYAVYKSTRSSVDLDWGTPVPVPELRGEALFVSRDGLEFYATHTDRGFARWTRSIPPAEREARHSERIRGFAEAVGDSFRFAGGDLHIASAQSPAGRASPGSTEASSRESGNGLQVAGRVGGKAAWRARNDHDE